MLRHSWAARVSVKAESVEKAMRCRANVFSVEARHDGLEQGTQGELGVLSEAPQVQYCIVAARSRVGW
jgi:hypothetical protein